MEIGKLPPDLLDRLLAGAPIHDERVLIGPAVGEDAAVIKMDGDRVLVVKTDPITFATDDIGWYSVHVNANDIAATGAVPRWFLATLLVPESMEQADVEEIFNQIGSACRSLDIALIGGHTEITYDLDRPLIVGAMLGEARRDEITPTSGARVGDRIILTKGIAIEGTAVLAREASATLEARGMSRESLRRARDYLYDPGISVLDEAFRARACAKVHSMHDPTEGGLITGLQEIGRAAGVGMRVDLEQIPVLPETREICECLGLDPLGLLASGALVLTLSPTQAPDVLDALKESGIAAHDIGEIRPSEDGLVVVSRAGEEEMPTFSRDELARYFATSKAKN